MCALQSNMSAADDGQIAVLSDPSLQAILLDWRLVDDTADRTKAMRLIDIVRSRNLHIPIFLMCAKGDEASLTREVMMKVDELVWILEDTTFFIAGRVLAAVRRYRDQMMPPFTKALMKFASVYEYSWFVRPSTLHSPTPRTHHVHIVAMFLACAQAYARPHWRHCVSEIACWSIVLRILWRESSSL
jgi:hypothetical protein